MQVKQRKRVAVIGGGLAGLSAAYRLQQAGFDTTVYEKNFEVGGRTVSLTKNGYTMDLGAITLSPAYTETIQLIRDVGAMEECIEVKPVLGVARGGAIHRIDLSNVIISGIRTGFLSLGAKVGLVRLLPTLMKYWSKCDFSDMGQLEELDTETAESFALRVLGKETHEYLVDPIIRVNMFNSSKVSSAVDIVWLMKIFSGAKLLQVRSGMGAISSQIAGKLPSVHCGSTVELVEKLEDQVFISVNGRRVEFDAAVIATPPGPALEVAPWIEGRQREWFSSAKAVPSLTVHVGLCTQPDTDAALVMVPSSEAKDILGIALEHNKCPGRVPEGKALLALHMTGDWAKTQHGLSDTEVAASALDVARPFLGDVRQDVEMVNLHQWHWVDHERHVGVYRSLRQAQPQFMNDIVTFAGEYNAAGIEGAVIAGRKCADALVRKLA